MQRDRELTLVREAVGVGTQEVRMSYPDARYLGDSGEISAVYRPADARRR
jgi:hypothetical protein